MVRSLFDLTVPAFARALINLTTQLDKAAAHAERKKFDSKALADARLTADMLSLYLPGTDCVRHRQRRGRTARRDRAAQARRQREDLG